MYGVDKACPLPDKAADFFIFHFSSRQFGGAAGQYASL
jgi:hypothetical protein